MYFTFYKLVKVRGTDYILTPYIHIYNNMVEIHV